MGSCSSKAVSGPSKAVSGPLKDVPGASTDVEVEPLSAEDMAKLSLQDLSLAFNSLPIKGGQTYQSGRILKVQYRSEDHCNYSSSGFDAWEAGAWHVLLPVPRRGRDVGYMLDVGWKWEAMDRGTTDKDDFSAYVKLLPDGRRIQSGSDRAPLMAIVDELHELDVSAKSELKAIIQQCTTRN